MCYGDDNGDGDGDGDGECWCVISAQILHNCTGITLSFRGQFDQKTKR
jgi:hypothetical protein